MRLQKDFNKDGRNVKSIWTNGIKLITPEINLIIIQFWNNRNQLQSELSEYA